MSVLDIYIILYAHVTLHVDVCVDPVRLFASVDLRVMCYLFSVRLAM